LGQDTEVFLAVLPSRAELLSMIAYKHIRDHLLSSEFMTATRALLLLKARRKLAYRSALYRLKYPLLQLVAQRNNAAEENSYNCE
jgi:hypothetical protein